MSDNAHQTTLQPYLELHQAEIADLRAQADTLREMLRGPKPKNSPKAPPSRSALQSDLERIERSISKHEEIVGLARQEGIVDLLQTVADDPELAREAAADPRAFVERHGFELPSTMVIIPLVAGRDVSARMKNVDPDMPFEIAWTRDGFQAPPDPDHGPKQDGSRPGS